MITTSTKQDQQEINKELAISNGDLRLLPALEAALERLHINNIENCERDTINFVEANIASVFKMDEYTAKKEVWCRLINLELNIAIKWSIYDVREKRPDLSNEQALEVLQALKNNHDANIVIIW